MPSLYVVSKNEIKNYMSA